MSSLKTRLLFSLWAALIVTGVGSTALAYVVARQEAAVMLDYQMEQVARLMATQRPSDLQSQGELSPHQTVAHDNDDEMLVWVSDLQDRIVFSSQHRVQPPTHVQSGFQDIELAGRSYRVLSANTTTSHILVAQENEARWEMASGASIAALLPLVIFIPVLAVVIALVIRKQFRPVNSVITEIASRPPFALTALSTAGLPAELLPLVHEVNRLLVRLKDAVHQQQQFLADAAHALRTPLTALQLQADVLDHARTPEDRQERLLELRAGIRRAARLTNQLLALARDELKTAEVDLDTAITVASAMYMPIAAARSITLQLHTDVGVNVRTSAGALAMLVGNLLDNALRYTPPGGTVHVSTARIDDAVWIEVIDEGPGLPASEHEKVFGRFYRAPGDTTEGSGLGLSVVRNIAEQLGGHASLVPRQDRSGLIARVSLPISSGA